MPVVERSSGYQVTVHNQKALPGYRRIRKQINGTEAEAKALEAEIKNCLKSYGKWPVSDGDNPLDPKEPNAKLGTIRRAAALALETHWRGTPYHFTVKKEIWNIVDYFEQQRGVYDLDDIDSEDLDAYVEYKRLRGNKAVTINKGLSMLSVISKAARTRKPPLSYDVLPIGRLKAEPLERWWLRPEQMERLLPWLRDTMNDPLFADFVEYITREGLRVMETLDLEPRHFTGMDTSKPSLLVPGTKTEGSEATIPVFDDALELTKRCIKRANKNGWKKLFPMSWRQAHGRWAECRVYLEVDHIPTSTLKALRRTFAYYATLRGMPTSTLQRVLRQKTITTTVGYTDLVGSQEIDESRRYMSRPERTAPTEDSMSQAIKAFRETGASPEEMARFTKEIMRL